MQRLSELPLCFKLALHSIPLRDQSGDFPGLITNGLRLLLKLLRLSCDGVFQVAMAWKSAQDYPLDIDVTDPDSITWDVTFVAANERRVQLRVKAGNVYWVTIWSASAPGEPFVLTASLHAD